MKRTLLITLALLALASIPNKAQSPTNYYSSTTKVVICTGSSSKCYHKSDKCKGLSNCKCSIKTITLEEAEKQNRRPCKICYK